MSGIDNHEDETGQYTSLADDIIKHKGGFPKGSSSNQRPGDFLRVHFIPWHEGIGYETFHGLADPRYIHFDAYYPKSWPRLACMMKAYKDFICGSPGMNFAYYEWINASGERIKYP